MAQIKNAYIVHIDFDGDVKSKYRWGKWLVFTELKEVKSVIAEALNDLLLHEKEKSRFTITSQINNILENDCLLEDFIRYGGCKIGIWDISIYKTFEDDG